MEAELSVPVVWAEDGGSPVAGRLDVRADGLHFEGGHREARHARAVGYDQIGSAQIGREHGKRINGRPAIILSLVGGATVAFAGIGRPGTLAELLHRIEGML